MAKNLPPVINARRARDLGVDYHDKRVLDQLDSGHRNMSRCEPITVLSANHSGALRFHEALDEQFEHDSSSEFGWLQPVVCDKTPLVLQLGDERVKTRIWLRLADSSAIQRLFLLRPRESRSVQGERMRGGVSHARWRFPQKRGVGPSSRDTSH